MPFAVKQSTAVTVPVMAFATDGIAALTSAFTSAQISVLKPGSTAAIAALGGQSTIHAGGGCHLVPLATGDVSALGMGKVFLNAGSTTQAPAWADIQIIPAITWDTLYGSETTRLSALTTSGVAALSTAQLGGMVNDGTGVIDIAQLKIDGGASRAVEIKSTNKEAVYLEAAGAEAAFSVNNTSSGFAALFAADTGDSVGIQSTSGRGIELIAGDDGINIDAAQRGVVIYADGNAVDIRCITSGDAVHIQQDGTGTALEITGNTTVSGTRTFADSTDVNVISWLGTTVDSALTTASIPAISYTEVSAFIGAAETDIDALSAQIAGIGSGTGAALNYAPAADNTGGAIADAPATVQGVAFVGTQTGTFANLSADDAVYHVITNTGNNLDIIYQYKIGAGRNCSKIPWKGYVSASSPSTSKTLTFQAYDFVNDSWSTRATQAGQPGSTDVIKEISLLSTHTGTGTYAGHVYLRLVASAQTGIVARSNVVLAQAQNLGTTVGYDGGQVWFDTADGIAGTTPFVNGTADNPTDSWASALTIATAVGLHRYYALPDSDVTLGAAFQNSVLSGSMYQLDFNGQDVSGSAFEGAESLTGAAIVSGIEYRIDNCHINAGFQTGEVDIYGCAFASTTMKLLEATSYFADHCWAVNIDGNWPMIDFDSLGGSAFILSHWAGEITITNMAAGDSIVVDGTGKITFDATCAGGTATIRGASYVDNSGGAVTITAETGESLTTADIDATITANTYIGEIRSNTFTSNAEESFARAYQKYTASVMTAGNLDGALANDCTADRVLLATESVTVKGISINPGTSDQDLGVLSSDGVTNTWTQDAGWSGQLSSDLYLLLDGQNIESDVTITFTAKRLYSGSVPEDIEYEMLLKPGGNYQTWGTDNVARGLYNCTVVSEGGGGGGGGTGSVTWTTTVDDGSSPIADCKVWATTDAGGLNVVADGYTDAFGVVTFYLNPGTYYMWAQKSGFNFTNPTTQAVA